MSKTEKGILKIIILYCSFPISFLSFSPVVSHNVFHCNDRNVSVVLNKYLAAVRAFEVRRLVSRVVSSSFLES